MGHLNEYIDSENQNNEYENIKPLYGVIVADALGAEDILEKEFEKKLLKDLMKNLLKNLMKNLIIHIGLDMEHFAKILGLIYMARWRRGLNIIVQ